MLTTRTIGISGGNTQRVSVRLSAKEAVYARDASIKTIYEHIFGMIVTQVNHNLSGIDCGNSNNGATAQELSRNPELSFISILDIYGFENYEINSYDQFLINYANESLQNIFNRYTLDCIIIYYDCIMNLMFSFL